MSMTHHFAVLPAPPGYQLVEIAEDVFDGEIDKCISEPHPVLGFVVRKQETYFSVLPVTVFGVHDAGGGRQHALIRPDGTVDYYFGGGKYVLESVEDLKVFILREQAELAREMAQGDEKNKDRKQAAYWRRHAKKLENEADEIG
jgi:hypothetical protein